MIFIMEMVGSTSMLLAFRAENTRSFRESLDLSLEATALAEAGVPREIPWREGGTRCGFSPSPGCSVPTPPARPICSKAWMI